MNPVQLAVIVIFSCLCPTEIYSAEPELPWDGTDDCLLNTQGSNGPKMPVAYGKNGTRTFFMYPDNEGLLNIRNNFTFKLLCAKSQFVHSDLFEGTEISVTCVVDNYLMYRGRAYKYEMFECEAMPRSELVVTKDKCQSNHTVAAVGFRGFHGLVVLYKVCFDMANKNALYTWYNARTPYHELTQKYKKRPAFIKSPELYGKLDVNRKYTVNEQRRTVAQILKSAKLGEQYIKSDGKYSLSRGHFAAKADFYYAYEQIATFYYANVAPQWQTFNGKQWADLEKTYREMLDEDEDVHLVVTGTYGSCTLPDNDNVEQPLFLEPPSKIPVPLFYWKVMYDMVEKKGLVYLGMNNPYKPSDKSTFLCRNVCPNGIKGIREENFDSTIYCCSIESFENVYGKLDPQIYEPLNGDL